MCVIIIVATYIFNRVYILHILHIPTYKLSFYGFMWTTYIYSDKLTGTTAHWRRPVQFTLHLILLSDL